MPRNGRTPREFGYLKITVERLLCLNFEVSDARIARVKANAVFVGGG